MLTILQLHSELYELITYLLIYNALLLLLISSFMFHSTVLFVCVVE